MSVRSVLTFRSLCCWAICTLLCTGPWIILRSACLIALIGQAESSIAGTQCGSWGPALQRLTLSASPELDLRAFSEFVAHGRTTLIPSIAGHALATGALSALLCVLFAGLAPNLLDQRLRHTSSALFVPGDQCASGASRCWQLLLIFSALACPLATYGLWRYWQDRQLDGVFSVGWMTTMGLVTLAISLTMAAAAALVVGWVWVVWRGEPGEGGARVCAQCAYPAATSSSEVCVECGTTLLAWNTRPRQRLLAARLGVACGGVLLASALGILVSPQAGWLGGRTPDGAARWLQSEFRFRSVRNEGSRVEWTDGTACDFIVCWTVAADEQGRIDTSSATLVSARRWTRGVQRGEVDVRAIASGVPLNQPVAFDLAELEPGRRVDDNKVLVFRVLGSFRQMESITNECVAKPVSIERVQRLLPPEPLPGRKPLTEANPESDLWESLFDWCRVHNLRPLARGGDVLEQPSPAAAETASLDRPR